MAAQRNGTLGRRGTPCRRAYQARDPRACYPDGCRVSGGLDEANMARGPFQGFHGVLQLRAQPHLAMLAPREHA